MNSSCLLWTARCRIKFLQELSRAPFSGSGTKASRDFAAIPRAICTSRSIWKYLRSSTASRRKPSPRWARFSRRTVIRRKAGSPKKSKKCSNSFKNRGINRPYCRIAGLNFGAVLCTRGFLFRFHGGMKSFNVAFSITFDIIIYARSLHEILTDRH